MSNPAGRDPRSRVRGTAPGQPQRPSSSGGFETYEDNSSITVETVTETTTTSE